MLLSSLYSSSQFRFYSSKLQPFKTYLTKYNIKSIDKTILSLCMENSYEKHLIRFIIMDCKILFDVLRVCHLYSTGNCRTAWNKRVTLEVCYKTEYGMKLREFEKCWESLLRLKISRKERWHLFGFDLSSLNVYLFVRSGTVNDKYCLLCCYGVDGLLHHGVDEGVEFLLGEANVKPAPHPLHRAAAVVEAGQLGA